MKKGRKDFLSLITRRIDNEIHILSVLKGREKAEIKAFSSSIPKKKRKTIVSVCCDMYDGYINASKEIFGKTIPIVVDRFHVAKLYRKGLVSIRKKELVRLRKELPKEYPLLKPAIAILINKKECSDHDEKMKLELLFKHSSISSNAYF